MQQHMTLELQLAFAHVPAAVRALMLYLAMQMR
jgi:hypothetical protein